MKRTYRAIFFLACSIFLLNCSQRSNYINIAKEINTDPYIKSFWQKGIKYIVRQNPLNTYDTIKFDEDGNMEEIQSLGRLHVKANYDTVHRLTKHWIGGDLAEHNLISYQEHDNIVIQKWIRIMTFNWNYKPEDVNQQKSFYIVFIFNSKNQLTKQINLKENYIIKYEYEKETLSQTDKFDLQFGSIIETVKYFYKHKTIKQIEEYYYANKEAVKSKDHYFNNGRLDSTQYFSREEQVHSTLKYSYIYF